jgi:hypothetical protein
LTFIMHNAFSMYGVYNCDPQRGCRQEAAG